VAKFLRSSLTFLKAGVAVPFLSASLEGKQTSAWRYSAGPLPSRLESNLVRSARTKPLSA